MITLPADFIESVIEQACVIQLIPAPTFNEQQRAAYFLKQLEGLGLQDVQQDATGNVLGRLPGSQSHRGARPVVISAHMDTVHPLDTPLGVRIAGDRVIGSGIGDNAVGLAAGLGLLRLLRQAGTQLPGDLWLAFNVCEEGLGDLRGIQAVVDRFQGAPLAYIVLEGLGLGTVLHRGLGVERYRITVQTPGGHSWVDYGQPSAIHELCELVSRVTSVPLPAQPCTTMNVGVIHGGTSINTIAPHAWMELDLRSESKTALSALVQQVQNMVRAAQRGSIQVRLERIGRRQAGEIAENHPLVNLAREVLVELSIEPRLDIASTDANLPLSRGYPSICVGITHGNNAHTGDEYILISPVARGMQQLYLLITRLWGRLA
jgi:acetylornithine deacetylase/succinyl-diaminopimelate desuccinylase-like protein